ncbi:hypothetical protein Pam2_180 [Pseudanabaena phage Pam2]|nr:hypothetical protein Pam2_180 [Pseudanabaena phage Pam2]
MNITVTGDNIFQAAQALYWYCTNYHGGMSCPLYSILSARLQYIPSPSEVGVSHDDASGLFYAELESGEILADNLLNDIHSFMEGAN